MMAVAEYRTLRAAELEEQMPGTDSPKSPNTIESSNSRSAALGVTHKVDSKRDTLAGLAIRYNVSVADIKRANGLLSDNALFARDVIHIPTAGMPLGEELQLMIAQVATGFGRDRVLNAEANLHPASAAAARVARTLNIINGQSYPPDDGSGMPWWCHCGGCDREDAQASCRTSRGGAGSDSDPGEYEMQERSPGAGSGPEGPTRLHGRMRRRKAFMADGEGGESDGAEGSAPMQQQQWQRRMPPRPPGPHTASLLGSGAAGQQGEGMSAVLKQLSDFGRKVGEMSLIQKIKAAASQPALAVPAGSRHSLAQAADAVLGSASSMLARRSAGLAPGASGSAGSGLPVSRHASNDGRQLPVSRASKTGGKDD